MQTEAKPLPKSIYLKLKEAGVKIVLIKMEGGNDEANYYVDLQPYVEGLESEIESWAWDAYEFSGAGDGNAYGTDIKYDLVNGTMSSSEWYTTVVNDKEEVEPLLFEEEGNPDTENDN